MAFCPVRVPGILRRIENSDIPYYESLPEYDLIIRSSFANHTAKNKPGIP